jgi:hypothetical protein
MRHGAPVQDGSSLRHNYGIEIFNFDGAITGYDKGGNVARGNGQPAQCLNLTCSSN